MKFIYIRFIINLILNFIYLLLFFKNMLFTYKYNLFKKLLPNIFCFQILYPCDERNFRQQHYSFPAIKSKFEAPKNMRFQIMFVRSK